MNTYTRTQPSALAARRYAIRVSMSMSAASTMLAHTPPGASPGSAVGSGLTPRRNAPSDPTSTEVFVHANDEGAPRTAARRSPCPPARASRPRRRGGRLACPSRRRRRHVSPGAKPCAAIASSTIPGLFPAVATVETVVATYMRSIDASSPPSSRSASRMRRWIPSSSSSVTKPFPTQVWFVTTQTVAPARLSLAMAAAAPGTRRKSSTRHTPGEPTSSLMTPSRSRSTKDRRRPRPEVDAAVVKSDLRGARTRGRRGCPEGRGAGARPTWPNMWTPRARDCGFSR